MMNSLRNISGGKLLEKKKAWNLMKYYIEITNQKLPMKHMMLFSTTDKNIYLCFIYTENKTFNSTR